MSARTEKQLAEFTARHRALMQGLEDAAVRIRGSMDNEKQLAEFTTRHRALMQAIEDGAAMIREGNRRLSAIAGELEQKIAARRRVRSAAEREALDAELAAARAKAADEVETIKAAAHQLRQLLERA